jgi:hypothetical protein
MQSNGRERQWRRERDSNPRYGFPYSGFQDHPFQPLTHPSARYFQMLLHMSEGLRSLDDEHSLIVDQIFLAVLAARLFQPYTATR